MYKLVCATKSGQHTCAELLDDEFCCNEPIPPLDVLPMAPLSAFDAFDTGCGLRGNRSSCCRAAFSNLKWENRLNFDYYYYCINGFN